MEALSKGKPRQTISLHQKTKLYFADEQLKKNSGLDAKPYKVSLREKPCGKAAEGKPYWRIQFNGDAKICDFG